MRVKILVTVVTIYFLTTAIGNSALSEIIGFAQFNQWNLMKLKDPFTDSLITSAFVLEETAPLKKKPARFIFTCGPEGYGFMVDWGVRFPKPTDEIDVKMRFDDGEPTIKKWRVLNKDTGMIMLNMADSVLFSFTYGSKEKLAMQIERKNTERKTAIFDISDIHEVVTGIVDVCSDDLELHLSKD